MDRVREVQRVDMRASKGVRATANVQAKGQAGMPVLAALGESVEIHGNRENWNSACQVVARLNLLSLLSLWANGMTVARLTVVSQEPQGCAIVWFCPLLQGTVGWRSLAEVLNRQQQSRGLLSLSRVLNLCMHCSVDENTYPVSGSKPVREVLCYLETIKLPICHRDKLLYIYYAYL